MGTTSSHHHNFDHQAAMMEQPIYPDMNVIFKGIPKMMQVADDMHILSQAIIDMRNLTFALSFIMLLGMVMFLVLRCLQTRGKLRKRRRRLLTDSEHSSLSRRHYAQKPLDWNHHHHHQHKIDMEKLLEHSSSHGGSQQYTPPTMTPKRIPDYHSVERTPPPNAHNSIGAAIASATTSVAQPTATGPHATSNGTAIKPLEPVKLMIDEVPYVDSNVFP